jgi:hypothetical protein
MIIGDRESITFFEYTMDQLSLYQTVYQILNKTTPLRFDCGKLCGRACCQNLACDMETGEDSGMYLFPGEEQFLQTAAFLDIIPVFFEFSPGSPISLATCKGQCDRSFRPLACRIFPLTPYLTEKDILLIRIDPRSVPICPLAQDLERTNLHPDFINAVRKACRILITDPGIKDYVAGLSRMFDEYNHFLGEKF